MTERLTLPQIIGLGLLAFFIAGALVFPLLNFYYMDRVIFSLGLVGLAYGVESIVRLGHIGTCGFTSGNCSDHSVRAVGFVFWALLLVWKYNRPKPPQPSGE
jgi:hypothetical protein